LMESFIQYCQAQKIPVPPPFYRAKHKLAEIDDFPTHPVPDRDEPEFDGEAYAKKLNEMLEARWAKEKAAKEAPFPSHPIPD
jgi:hypothetical protein